MSTPVLKKLPQAIAGTRTNEISCQECFEDLDRYAELARSVKPAEEVLPGLLVSCLLFVGHVGRCNRGSAWTPVGLPRGGLNGEGAVEGHEQQNHERAGWGQEADSSHGASVMSYRSQ